jgi:hypothetical protein
MENEIGRDASSSIKLDNLSSKTVELMQDLHIDRNGQVDIKDAIQAIVYLKKQSQSYRRISISIFVVATIVLFCTFGAAMLAIKLNKDMQTENDALVNLNGDVIRTGIDINGYNLPTWLSDDTKDASQLTSLTIGDLTMDLTGSFIYNGGITFFTPFFTLDLNNVNSTSIFMNPNFRNDTAVQNMIDYVASMVNIPANMVSKQQGVNKIINLGEYVRVNSQMRVQSLKVSVCSPGYTKNRFGQCVATVFS